MPPPERPDPPSIRIPGPLRAGRFVERPNRFLLRVRLDPIDPIDPADPFGASGAPGPAGGAEGPDAAGPVVEAHLPDPGRLKELLLSEAKVWLRPASGAHRRTRWTAVLVERPDGGGAVSMDTGLPNRLILKALEVGALDELAGWHLVRSEWSHGGSRFDFLLEDGNGRSLALEVKSVTLWRRGWGSSPTPSRPGGGATWRSWRRSPPGRDGRRRCSSSCSARMRTGS